MLPEPLFASCPTSKREQGTYPAHRCLRTPARNGTVASPVGIWLVSSPRLTGPLPISARTAVRTFSYISPFGYYLLLTAPTTRSLRGGRAPLFLYRERESNPHSHHWPRDFHTNLVSLLGLCLSLVLTDLGCGCIVSTHLGVAST